MMTYYPMQESIYSNKKLLNSENLKINKCNHVRTAHGSTLSILLIRG